MGAAAATLSFQKRQSDEDQASIQHNNSTASPEDVGSSEALPPVDAKAAEQATALHERLCASMKPTLHANDTYVINLDWRGDVEEQEWFRHGSVANFDPLRPPPRDSPAGASSSGSGTGATAEEGGSSGNSRAAALTATKSASNMPHRQVSARLKNTAGGQSNGGGFVRVQSRRVGPSAGDLNWTASRRALEVLLVDHQAEDVDPVDHRNHEQRLQERLDKLYLDMIVMAGDGNCQFRSISNELFGTPDKHDHVRKKAVEHLREHREEFEPFLGEDFDHYVEHMGRAGTWGDELTLRAACDSYGITVHVVTSETSHWYLTYAPSKALPNGREIFLTYIAPIHYNAIRRKGALRSLGVRTIAAVGSSFKRIGSLKQSPTPPSLRTEERGPGSAKALPAAGAAGSSSSKRGKGLRSTNSAIMAGSSG